MSNDERAIRDSVQRWMAASRAGDSETTLSLLTNDVIFMMPGQKPFGKKAFAARSAKMKNARITGSCAIQEIKVLGDWAWMRNRLRITVTPPGGRRGTHAGYTLTVLRRQSNGAWAIARDANVVT